MVSLENDCTLMDAQLDEVTGGTSEDQHGGPHCAKCGAPIYKMIDDLSYDCPNCGAKVRDALLLEGEAAR